MISASMVKELREISGAGMLDCKKALEETNGNLEEAANWLREKGISKAKKKADRIASEGIASIMTSENKAVVIEVNSETDFVAQNTEFTSLVETILTTIINSNATTVEAALKLPTSEGTLEDLIIAKTAKIGEKISLRRVEVITKESNDIFGDYIHMGGRIATLVVIENSTNEVAKSVAMHVAAMRPTYVSKIDVPEEVVNKEKEVLKEQAINEGKKAEFAEKMVEGRIRKYYEEICLEEQPFVKDDKIKVGEYVKNNNGKIKNMIRFEVGEGMEKKEENFADEVMKQIKN